MYKAQCRLQRFASAVPVSSKHVVFVVTNDTDIGGGSVTSISRKLLHPDVSIAFT